MYKSFTNAIDIMPQAELEYQVNTKTHQNNGVTIYSSTYVKEAEMVFTACQNARANHPHATIDIMARPKPAAWQKYGEYN